MHNFLRITYFIVCFQSEIVLAAMDATKHAKTAKVHVNAGYPTSMVFLVAVLKIQKNICTHYMLSQSLVAPIWICWETFLNWEAQNIYGLFAGKKT